MKSLILATAMSVIPFFAFGQSYAKLWQQVEAHEEDGKPKSACDVVEKILQKARRSGDKGQALSACLKRAALRQEWAPDSFFTDILELETLRKAERSVEARAVYASILAQLYEGNRFRTQAHDMELTSDDIREWTTEQYDSAAADNWRLSMQDLPTLAKARSKDWLPLMEQNKESSYFKHDLLHILWHRYLSRSENVWHATRQDKDQMAQQVAEVYRGLGNREATLLIELDRIELGLGTSATEHFQQLKQEYGDLPLCAELYIKQINRTYYASEKLPLCRECIQRYPKYERIGIVRNSLNEALRPRLSWSGENIYYPGRTYEWPIRAYNTDTLCIELFRMPADLLTSNFIYLDSDKGCAFIRKNGTPVDKIVKHLASVKEAEEVKDTVRWTAYDPGLYAIIFTAKTTQSEAKEPTTSTFDVFRCTRLQTLHQDELGAQRTVVVDAMSGQPIEGADVEFYRYEGQNNEKKVTLLRTQTNAEGRATMDESLLGKVSETRLYTRVSMADDIYLPEEQSYYYRKRHSGYSDSSQELRLYTDRAIYRPGQTVYVGGILFNREHWDAEVCTDSKMRLRLLDANWKEVASEEVKPDEMGKISTSFVLPAKGLPGSYHIRCESLHTSLSFRVEEYKRPTFEVKMDEAPDLQWPQDSITLTGKAIGYNGVPVRQASVTGKYQFTYPFWWWGYRHDDSERMPIDTVQTDETGQFSIRVPLSTIPKAALNNGMMLVVETDVLSIAGETRQGRISVPLCTKPLRLQLTVPEQLDRDRMTDIGITLLSSTSKPTDGTVEWAIYPANEGKRVGEDIVMNGTLTTKDKQITFPTEQLKTLPTGQYEFYAKAYAPHGGTEETDSAEAKGYFLIFSMTDSRLPKTTAEWLYCPDDTFGPGRTAHVLVGSSFEDVAFYYSIVAADSVVEERLIRLSDEMRLLEIPYLESYGDGATLHTAFVKKGRVYKNKQTLRLEMPDNKLRWEWKSFRDNLQPGQKETWTLRITRPDGTPASAQLMATLYDASLDALVPHAWNIFVSRYYHITELPFTSQSFFYNNSSYKSLDIAMRKYEANDMEFDTIDEEWLEGLSFGYGGGRRYEMLADGMVPMAEPMVMRKAARAASRNGDMDDVMMAEESAEAEAEEQNSNDTSDERVGAANPSVRTNFNETAAFLPRLMANANGEVTLSFTLPESLTTWQLLGIAHTADMQTTTVRAQATARKDLMARLYLPRFLRGGDKASLRATVQNLSQKTLNGKATLEVFDPETERIIIRRTATFKTEANGESLLTFDYTPDELPSVVAVRLTAQTGTFSDGEQHYLPILPSKTWITESVEVRADSLGTFTTDLTSLFNSNSPTATNRRLTVEYTTHPIWHALQALPSLRTPQSDDIISLTSSLYAEALATYIANTPPRLKTLVELWQREQAQGQPALESRLAQDEELKQIILDETPWLREAESDTERKARLIELFDETLQHNTLGELVAKLCRLQGADGSFAWFPGMNGSELMTRVVVMELTHLRTLTNNFQAMPSSVHSDINAAVNKAFGYLADKTAEDIVKMKKAEKEGNEVSTAYLMYLDYVYITQRAGVSLNKKQQSDVRYLLDHLKGSVADMDNNERAKTAIVLKADGRTKEARKYFESLLEHSTTTAERGTFFDTPSGSFVPTGNKIIVHTAAMEAAVEFGSEVKGMRRWLLQQKRTQMWESSICTTDAIYALLVGNRAALDNSTPDGITLNYANRKVDVTRETADAAISGMGYVKQQFADGEAPRSITVERRTDSEAWGAVFATYLTPIADASATSTGLKVRHELSTETPDMGQRITIRYVITAERDYDYVCLSAERPACAEPADLLSGYSWRNGLGYYRAVRDTRTDYFFDRLPKGTYILEETAFIDREGSYATGLTTLKCLYAPEFTANTTSKTLQIITANK